MTGWKDFEKHNETLVFFNAIALYIELILHSKDSFADYPFFRIATHHLISREGETHA